MLTSHPELFQYPAAARRFPVHHIHRAWRQWRNRCHRPHPLRQRRRQRWPRHQHRRLPPHRRWRQRRRRCWWRQWCRKRHRKRLRKSRLRPGGEKTMDISQAMMQTNANNGCGGLRLAPLRGFFLVDVGSHMWILIDIQSWNEYRVHKQHTDGLGSKKERDQNKESLRFHNAFWWTDSIQRNSEANPKYPPPRGSPMCVDVQVLTEWMCRCGFRNRPSNSR